MKRQVLAQTELKTSRLGFGCVQLTAHSNRREAVAMLEHAFSLGITHFDVARVYGFGRAESILSEFLRSKRDRVSVATKFGLKPPSGLAGKGKVIDIAKKVLQPFPWLLNRAKTVGAGMGSSGNFSPGSAIESLETSLRELRTDYVDLLLLHEATIGDAITDGLIETLQRQVEAGKVRYLGIASDAAKLRDICGLPVSYSILQFNDNVAMQNVSLVPEERRGIITHSIFKPMKPLIEAIVRHPEESRKFAATAKLDVTDPKTINSLLLRYALQSNPNGVVLFASTNPNHVSANVREAEAFNGADDYGKEFMHFADKILKSPPEMFDTTPTT